MFYVMTLFDCICYVVYKLIMKGKLSVTRLWPVSGELLCQNVSYTRLRGSTNTPFKASLRNQSNMRHMHFLQRIAVRAGSSVGCYQRAGRHSDTVSVCTWLVFLFLHTPRIERIQPILSVFVFNISIFPLSLPFHPSYDPPILQFPPFFYFLSSFDCFSSFPQPPSSLLFSPHFVCI